MQTLLQDLRYGTRMLVKHPGFTLVAVLTLSLGIGLNTALFSVVNAVLLRSLPYAEPEQLVQISEFRQTTAVPTSNVSPNNFLDWRAETQSFSGVSAWWFWLYTLTGTKEPTEINGARVSANLFALLGVAPHLGRTFLPEEETPNKHRVVVISHAFWQQRFSGKPDALGQTLQLDGEPYSIIGVLRPDFVPGSLFSGYNAELWTPLVLNPQANQRASHYLSAIGRLRPGVTQAQAQAEMTTLASRLAQTYPTSNADWSVRLTPLQEQLTRNVRWALLVLLAATVLVLLIACTNVANLLLARVAAREREMAVRAALGAGWQQLVRLLLAESLVLAALGGAFGLLLAQWGVALVVALAPRDIPRLESVGVDGRVLGFTLLMSLLTVVFFGLVPAWQATRVNLNAALKEGGRSAPRGHGLRSALVVAEVALTLVLLVSAGLLLRSLSRMQTVDLGFNPERLLTLRVSLLEAKYRERQQVADFYQQLTARATTLPGVSAAAVTSAPPLIRLNNMWTSFEIEGRPNAPGFAPTARYAVVSPEYFRALEIPLRKGRDFNDRDSREALPVAVINENFARRHFPDADPLGKKITVGGTQREIVGIVGNVRHETPMEDEAEKLYAPHAQNPRVTVMLLLRTTIDPSSVAASAQQAVWAIDPEAAVSNVAPMTNALAEVMARPRFNTRLLGLFAVVALLLAAVGIYGVMSYTVTQNTREIGIRVALGAQTSDVLRLIVGQGLVLALLGVGAGLLGAFAVTRSLRTLLFGVTPTDPLTFALVAVVLVLVALLACWLPARRAAKVDPMIALRCE